MGESLLDVYREASLSPNDKPGAKSDGEMLPLQHRWDFVLCCTIPFFRFFFCVVNVDTPVAHCWMENVGYPMVYGGCGYSVSAFFGFSRLLFCFLVV